MHDHAQRQFDIEHDELVRQYNDGEIDNTEFNRAMRELQRDYSAMAEEAAMEAYDTERARW